MGVRGLTTFISSNHRKYLKKFKLHDCYIIIDGYSLAYHLYLTFSSKAHSAFGGDYDRYAIYIRDFFSLLSKCGVKAIVLFDGGYEPRKIRTVLSRMKDRVSALSYVEPTSQNSSGVFSLLMKPVFKETLREINIPIVQCDFEADQEIASLARTYNCPVLSYDSDFYIYDVNYIPIPTIEHVAAPLTFELGEASEKFCINCKMYKVDYFLDSFGGLDKSMLPLLASLLGNDYIKMKVFKKFYSQFKIPKGKSNPLQRKIGRLIEWLRNETFDSAVKRILGRMKNKRHASVMKSIKKVVNAYVDLNVTVDSYLPLEFKNLNPIENQGKLPEVSCNLANSCSPVHNNDGMDIDGEVIPYENKDDVDLDDSDETSCSSNDDVDHDNSSASAEMDVEMIDEIKHVQQSNVKKCVKMPEWLLDISRKGNIDSCIFDIMTLGTYFAIPQMEDRMCKSSHLASIQLLKHICKLLVGDNFENISVWMRNRGNKVQRFKLHLNSTKKLTEIESIPSLHTDQKMSLLLQCLNIPSDFCLDSFPEEWKLYMCAIVFWVKHNNEPQITESHLCSLLMCIIALSLIDSKVGFFRKKYGFLKKYGKLRKKIIKSKELDILDDDLHQDDEVEEEESEHDKIDIISLNLEETVKTFSEPTTINGVVSSINIEDCIAVFDTFYKYHQVDENLKIDKKLYSLKTIHVFSQFQSCLFHTIILNSLLGEPLERTIISRLYSGTFVYNICVAFNKLRNIRSFIECELRRSPNILRLIEMMLTALASVVEIVPNTIPPRKRNNRKKKKTTINSTDNCEMSDENNVEDVKENKAQEDDDDDYHDENNIYSVLSHV